MTTSSPTTATAALTTLPAEIVDGIFSYLQSRELARLAVTSKWCSRFALPRLWHEIDLQDCSAEVLADGNITGSPHDDRAIIEKLLTIASNAAIASHVKVINHSCHEPPPYQYSTLHKTLFVGQTVSYDPRLMQLVFLASRKLHNVHTLRIVNGHPRLTEALLRCLFDRTRQSDVRIRRLWLESCRLSPELVPSLDHHGQDLPTQLSFEGLESLRLRRLHIPNWDMDHGTSKLSSYHIMHRVSRFDFPANVHTEWIVGQEDLEGRRGELERYFAMANSLDDEMFDAISKVRPLPDAVLAKHIASHEDRAEWAYRQEGVPDSGTPTPAACVSDILGQCADTITSLTFDWVSMKTERLSTRLKTSTCEDLQLKWLRSLFMLRFSSLKAFQFRNCQGPETKIYEGINMLDTCRWTTSKDETDVGNSEDTAVLDFLAAHVKLQCLAWRMDRFFAEQADSSVCERAASVMSRLSSTLTDLRIETSWRSGFGAQSTLHASADPALQSRRRRFITEFASSLTALRGIKMSGGIAFDERREVLRAMGRCPLERVSLISDYSSIGNTWGRHVTAVHGLVLDHERDLLTVEEQESIHANAYGAPPTTLPPFQASYGWKGSGPMVTVISNYHHNTLRELKLIGSQGTAAVLQPTAITHAMLAGLRHLHKLELLILSVCVPELFEGESCWPEIRQFWRAPSSPDTTALAILDEDDSGGNAFQAFLNQLRPDRLAASLVKLLGPHLSTHALSRRHGLRLSANLTVGSVSHFFELDVCIGLDETRQPTVLAHTSMIDEHDEQRRRRKLEQRRWF